MGQITESTLRAKLEEEYQKVRSQLPRLHAALERVEVARAEDDIVELLGELEDTAKDIRTGGLIGAGAKAHHEALEDLNELLGK